MENPPDWYLKAVVGDLPLSLICTYNGYAYYIDEVMSAYRIGVKGSVTDTWAKKYSIEQKINLQREYMKIWNSFDQYSNSQYAKQIAKQLLLREYTILALERNIRKIINKRYKEISFRIRIIILTKCLFPKSYEKLIYIKHNVLKL